jgi:hypothetical protein
VNETPETPENDDEIPAARPVFDGPSVTIEHEMRTSYLDYAMSVIVSRAIRKVIPQVCEVRGRCDGFLPPAW